MTTIAATCACGRDADFAQLGWGWCRECYYDLMLIIEAHTVNPRERMKGVGHPKHAFGPLPHRDTANKHDRCYHGGNAPHD